MVKDKGIEPHVPIFEKGERSDGTFSRSDFDFDEEADHYTCPNGKQLKRFRRQFSKPRSGITKANTINYSSSQHNRPRAVLQQPRLRAALPCIGINVLSLIIGRDPEYSFFFHTNIVLDKNY
jgi:hypothetical protein